MFLCSPTKWYYFRFKVIIYYLNHSKFDPLHFSYLSMWIDSIFFHTIFQTIIHLPTIGSRQVTRRKKAPSPKTHRIPEGFMASDLKKPTGRVFDLDSGVRRVFHLQSLHSAPKIKQKKIQRRERQGRKKDITYILLKLW